MDSGLIDDPSALPSVGSTRGVAMTRFLTAAVLALVLGCPACPTSPASAQTNPELTNDLIDFEYHEPESEQYKPLYLRMKERKILERLAEVLSPLKLQGALMLSLEEGDKANCKYPNSYYDNAGTLHLCYSWFYYLENEVSKETKREPNEPFSGTTPGLMPGITRAEVIIGGTISVMFHELGHALFDIQDIPLFGREEDGADQIAALVMLQFGKDVALTTIKGTFNVWHHSNARRLRDSKGKISRGQEADEHSIAIQRAYVFLCMAYGKDPEAFEALADIWLPRIRKDNCASEYKQAAQAFNKTIRPDLDEDKLNKVLKMNVLRPDDFKFD